MENSEKRKEDGEEFGRRFSSNIGRKTNEKKNRERSKEHERYLLLSALGIYVIHRIARDFLHSAIKDGIDYKQKEYFKKKLDPIKSFDWRAKTSPLAALGGMKGVSKAYDLLSEVIGQEKYSTTSEKPLGVYLEKKR